MSTVRDMETVSYEIINLERPTSLFEFVDTQFPQYGFSSLRRILSQIRCLSGKTMVVEKLLLSDDVKEENEDISIRLNGAVTSVIKRISFFSESFTKADDLSSVAKTSFLGYVVVKKDNSETWYECQRVYESVILAPQSKEYHIRRSPKWICNILGYKFKINGYLYAQQNDCTNVCAHVALRTAASVFHPKGDMSYHEMNNILGIDHKNKKVGCKAGGLTASNLVKLLEHIGAKCFTYDPQKKSSYSYQELVYASIESGFPALIAFETGNSGHVIPVFGHSFNQDAWEPNANRSYFEISDTTGYIPSESWLNMFLTHDDNFGSYFGVHKQHLSADQSSLNNPQSMITKPANVIYALGTMPKESVLNPMQVQTIGLSYFYHFLEKTKIKTAWGNRLQYYKKKQQTVVRSLLVTKDEYLEHISEVQDWHNNSFSQEFLRSAILQLSKKYYWLVEVSIPELFSTNKRKIGEVLLQASSTINNLETFSGFALARLPDSFVFYENNQQFDVLPTGTDGHVELFGCEGL